jgi:hypothetical protein
MQKSGVGRGAHFLLLLQICFEIVVFMLLVSRCYGQVIARRSRRTAQVLYRCPTVS